MTEHKIEYIRRDAQKPVPDSKWYVNLNALAQIILMIPVAIINSIANWKANQKDDSTISSDSSSTNHWTTLDILNVTIVPACIISIYGLHTLYTARKLRKMSSDTSKLHTKLSQAQQSVLFRRIECNAYILSLRDVSRKIEECSSHIDNITLELHQLTATIKDCQIKLDNYESSSSLTVDEIEHIKILKQTLSSEKLKREHLEKDIERYQEMLKELINERSSLTEPSGIEQLRHDEEQIYRLISVQP